MKRIIQVLTLVAVLYFIVVSTQFETEYSDKIYRLTTEPLYKLLALLLILVVIRVDYLMGVILGLIFTFVITDIPMLSQHGSVRPVVDRNTQGTYEGFATPPLFAGGPLMRQPQVQFASTPIYTGHQLSHGVEHTHPQELDLFKGQHPSKKIKHHKMWAEKYINQ